MPLKQWQQLRRFVCRKACERRFWRELGLWIVSAFGTFRTCRATL